MRHAAPPARSMLPKGGTSTQCEVAEMCLRSLQKKVREGILVRSSLVLIVLGRNKIPSGNCRVGLRYFLYGSE